MPDVVVSTTSTCRPASRGGVGRVADGGDLRLGEDHARAERAVGAVRDRGVAAEEVVGGDPRLVLAHVREQRLAVDVADRVQPRVAVGPHAKVDRDRRVGVEPELLEPDALGLRRAAERHEQRVALGGAAVGGRDDERAVALGHARRRWPQRMSTPYDSSASVTCAQA